MSTKQIVANDDNTYAVTLHVVATDPYINIRFDTKEPDRHGVPQYHQNKFQLFLLPAELQQLIKQLQSALRDS